MAIKLPQAIQSIDNINYFSYKILCAGVVKLVDALDSKSSGPCVRASSILASGTSNIRELAIFG